MEAVREKQFSPRISHTKRERDFKREESVKEKEREREREIGEGREKKLSPRHIITTCFICPLPSISVAC